uniref:Uncharacterized protein n=1 Tax=Percolomonas cosmopolitus TaxID=63605 RepID=A0A7S1KP89_9EUKA
MQSTTLPPPSQKVSVTPLHRQHVNDFYLYVENLEKENRHLKNEIKHLKAQLQRLNPPEKAKSHYDIKWNPVLKIYVNAQEKVLPSQQLLASGHAASNPPHDNMEVSLLFEFLTQNRVANLKDWLQEATTKWQKMHQFKRMRHGPLKQPCMADDEQLHYLLRPDPENYGRTLLHCCAMAFNYLTERTIVLVLEWIHGELLRACQSDEAKIVQYWTELFFQVDVYGFSAMHLMLMVTETKSFNQSIALLMRELIRLGVLRTETFLLGCAIQIRLTPQRSIGYKNRYLDTWWIEQTSYAALLIKYQDLLEFVREKDNLYESREWDLFLDDYAFLESILKDFSTDVNKSDYIQACIDGDDDKIKSGEGSMSPGVMIEGVYQAIAHGHTHVVKRWISEADNDDIQPGFFSRGFRDAVSNGHLDLVQLLTESAGIMADEADQINCIKNNRFKVFLYLASRSNLTRSAYCIEALKYIAREGKYVEFAKRIVALDWFQLPERFHEGDVFDLAFKHKNFELIDIICDSRTSEEEFTSVASYAIMLFCRDGDLDSVLTLTDNPKFNKRLYVWDSIITEHEQTAMFFAAAAGQLDLVKFLFTELNSRFGLPPNSNLPVDKRREREPKNAIHYAAQYGHKHIIEYIESVLSQRDYERLLCARGLDYQDHYKSKWAYEYAQENGHMQTMEYIIYQLDDVLERERERGITQSSEESLLPDYHPGERVVEEQMDTGFNNGAGELQKLDSSFLKTDRLLLEDDEEQ